MKQTIEYYYSLKIEELFLEQNSYHFLLDDKDYYFVHFLRSETDLDDLIECSKELKKKNIDCHNIIVNINNSVLTKVDDINYILLQVNNKDEIYSIVEMIQMNKKAKLNYPKTNLYRNNWAMLWSTKIDYIENQLTEIKIDEIIKKTIDYYIGLTENAIYYVNNISAKYSFSLSDSIVLAHKRIYYPNYKLNYLNPLSFIFDLEVRDIAEYIKSAFFANEDALLELQTYLKSVKLTNYSYNMLFARLLYPSYYFDLYEKIVNYNEKIDSLIDIINKNTAYEDFLKKAYKEISSYATLEKINWLIY